MVAANPPSGRVVFTSSGGLSAVSDSSFTFGGLTVVYGTLFGMRRTRLVMRAKKRSKGRWIRCLVMCGSKNGRPSWEMRYMHGFDPSLTSCLSSSCT